MLLSKRLSVAAAYICLSSAGDKTGIPTNKFSKDHMKGEITRKALNIHDKTGLNLRIYQYQSCPFSCKVRAFLDYCGFSYDEVQVNPVIKSQLDFIKDFKKAMYGAMLSFSGCTAFKELVTNTPIMHWYMAMKGAVECHGGEHLIKKKPAKYVLPE